MKQVMGQSAKKASAKAVKAMRGGISQREYEEQVAWTEEFARELREQDRTRELVKRHPEIARAALKE